MRSLLGDWRAVSERVARARSIALFLDFDGTLAAIDEDPRAVAMKGAVRVALMRLAAHPGMRVCIISGRRQADVRARVGVRGIEYLGVHGGDAANAGVSPGVERMVSDAQCELTTRLNGHGGSIQIEDKGMAFAVHHRRARASEEAYARGILDQVMEKFAGTLRVVPGDRVWEVLPLEIRGKGHAALRLWHLRSAGALPIYIGNDGTDEAAFGALSPGLTARVGVARQTRARYFLQNPGEVARFLEQLEEETR
jgi:trehalose 6-phosphate phosphatase